jgi:RND family efflux transporter MFP subunit
MKIRPHPLLLPLLLAAGIAAAADAPIAATGITEPSRDATLSSSVSGILSARNFAEGAQVNEGDVILELDKRLEELEVARRKLVMEARRTDFEATGVLFSKTKSVSKEELEKKEAEYRIAVVEHDIAAEQLRRRLVAAPIAGTITDLFLRTGEACQPHQPLARVVDTRHCFLVSNMEARHAARLKPGQPIDLEVQAGDATVRAAGTIIFISPVVDPASGLVKVRAAFENPEGQVRPGVAGKMLLR